MRSLQGFFLLADPGVRKQTESWDLSTSPMPEAPTERLWRLSYCLLKKPPPKKKIESKNPYVALIRKSILIFGGVLKQFRRFRVLAQEWLLHPRRPGHEHAQNMGGGPGLSHPKP